MLCIDNLFQPAIRIYFITVQQKLCMCFVFVEMLNNNNNNNNSSNNKINGFHEEYSMADTIVA